MDAVVMIQLMETQAILEYLAELAMTWLAVGTEMITYNVAIVMILYLGWGGQIR